MATINYKNFTLNIPGRRPPWSEDEYQFHKDIIDTTVKDCYSAEMDTTNGHRHYRVYDTGSNVLLRGVSQGSMRFEYSASRYLKMEIDQYGVPTLTPVTQLGYEAIKIPVDIPLYLGGGLIKGNGDNLVLGTTTGSIILSDPTIAEESIQLKDQKELILGDDGDAKISSPLATSNQTHIDLTGNTSSRGLLISLPTAEDGTGVAALRLYGAPRYCAIRKAALADIDSGHELGRMQFMGGAISDPYWEYGAWIAGYAASDWAVDDYPSELRIYVTKSGTSTAVNSAIFTADEKLKLMHSGDLSANAEIYASTYNILCLNSPAAMVDSVGHLAIKVYSQTTMPTMTYNNFFCFWKDTGDSDKIYLVFRRELGDQVKVQLT